MRLLEAAKLNEQWAGLSEQEASERLRLNGPNELPTDRNRGWLRIVADVLREPMLALLVLCGTIYVVLGDRAEAAMLLAFVAVIIAISVLQAQKAERTLDELRRLSAAQAIVIRSGTQRRIHAKNVVRDDLIVLIEGDRVPADAVLASGHVSIDESLLTGESAPVRKSVGVPAPDTMGKPGGNDSPFVFSGTLIVQGKGLGRVLETGKETQIGRIGRTLSTIAPEPARAQIETAHVVRRLAIVAVFLSVAVTLIYGYHRGSWLQAALVGIAFAMAIMPEELPVVLAAFFGLGSWRIAQKGVLTRYLPAIETLGAATVLCADKTGTITANQMKVSALWSPSGETWSCDGKAVPDAFHEILEFGALASHRDPFDPTERAIAEALHSFLAGTEHVHGDWTLSGEYPLSREVLAMSRVWSARGDSARRIIAAKGAPEAISDLCHLSANASKAVADAVDSLALRGLRVLGIARALYSSPSLPPSQHDFDFEFIGLVALEDPVRPGVPKAVMEAYSAGIRTIIITGDYPSTAVSIAQEIGLTGAERYITGAQLDDMSDDDLSERIKSCNVFCRVVPEQKLRIVEALKREGEIVAMTGDGVNDAPALKAAHVGVAMGSRGTDVAREAAALVLLNDDFGSILEAVKQGRRIFDNLRKAITFVTAAHVPIVGMSIIPLLFGMPLLLLPIHILFLQLIIDPACSIAFEAEPADPDVMKRPPRTVESRL
ncbi:MAG TPA: HAD-IC family P-type ATPase, partial [Candidatus Baltobacteraceae bacterium]|nr:HAD-IC family P-type ATPase [Candidatus Baltobacteraceae bacterium]